MYDSAVRQYGISKLFKTSTAFAFVIAGSAEREVNLLGGRCVGIHFKELPYPRVGAIQLNVGDRHLANIIADQGVWWKCNQAEFTFGVATIYYRDSIHYHLRLRRVSRRALQLRFVIC